MGRTCTVCAHDERHSINVALVHNVRGPACPDCIARQVALLEAGHLREQLVLLALRLKWVVEDILDYMTTMAYRRNPEGRRRAATKAIRRLREKVIERDGYVCGICSGAVLPEDLSIDHIVPISRGGSDDLSNLQVAHSRCNSGKCNTYAEVL